MKKLLITILILLLAAACNQQAQVQTQQNQNESSESQSADDYEKNKLQPPAVLPPFPTSIQGTLKVSDNSAKGNLMLIETDVVTINGKSTTIYLQTQRNFTDLLNGKVIVHFEGGPGEFILKDIKEVR